MFYHMCINKFNTTVSYYITAMDAVQLKFSNVYTEDHKQG